MNLYSEFPKAFDRGVNRFFRSKKLTKLYIVPMKCQRKEFYTVLTEKELGDLELKNRDELRVIGDTERDRSVWEETQTVINSPDVKRHDEMVRCINAEQKVRRLWQRLEEQKAKAEGE